MKPPRFSPDRRSWRPHVSASAMLLGACLALGGSLHAADLPLTPPRPAPPLEAVAQPAAAEAGENELWAVSTRSLSGACGTAPDDFQPAVLRYKCGRGWRKGSLSKFYRPQGPCMPTVILINGNTTESPQALAAGKAVFEALARSAAPGRSFRLVVWSWPSDRKKLRFGKDVQLKARRSDAEGVYLATFVSRFSCNEPVSMVGYSLGARIATGALHLLGGGTLRGVRMPPEALTDLPPLRAVLVAAALDAHWLAKGQRHGRALGAAERVTVLVNPRDRILRLYRRLPYGSGAHALGMHGALGGLGGLREKLSQVNVFDAVRRRHWWEAYLRSGIIIDHVRREALFERPLPLSLDPFPRESRKTRPDAD